MVIRCKAKDLLDSGATKASCEVACEGYKYFGLQGHGECRCGDSYGKYGAATGECSDASGPFFGKHKNIVYRRATESAGDAPTATRTVRIFTTGENGERCGLRASDQAGHPLTSVGGSGSGRLAVTCFDCQLRVLPFAELAERAAASSKPTGSKPSKPSPPPEPARTIKHDTKTGRWVVPFRAIWSAAGDAILCGGMKRTCDVYDASSGRRLASLASGLMTAIPSRNAVHASGKTVACATNSGRIHLFLA